MQARHVVAQLVRQQDREQRERKRHTLEQQGGMPPPQSKSRKIAFEIEKRQVVRKVILHAGANDRGRDERQQEQQQVQPVPLAAARPGRHTRFRTVGCGRGIVRRRVILRGHALLFRYRLYCRVCSSLPGLNRTALPGGMETSAPVRGFRPMPVLRGRTLKTPKPRSSMRSPLASERFMLSNTVSTAISALVLVMPVRLTTSLMMSSLITSASARRSLECSSSG